MSKIIYLGKINISKTFPEVSYTKIVWWCWWVKLISLGKIDISKACHVSVVYQNIVVVDLSKIIS